MVRPVENNRESLEDTISRIPGLDRVSFSPLAMQIERDAVRMPVETTLVTGELSVFTIPVTGLHQNCRILRCEQSGESAIIDPGGEPERIGAVIDLLNLDVKQILLTHAHPDHCGAVMDIKNKTGATLIGHPHWFERLMLAGVEPFKWLYGLKDDSMRRAPQPDRFIKGGESVTTGALTLNALATPGHSPGHLSYYEKNTGLLFAGDLIFREFYPDEDRSSFIRARTNIPGGNQKVFQNSLKSLLALPPETLVFSGHNDDYTLELATQKPGLITP